MADGVTIDFDAEEAEKLLLGYLKRVKRPEKLIDTLWRYVNAVTFKMFKGRRPDMGTVRGIRWKPLRQKTIDQKRALRKRGRAIESDRPLVRTGKMRDSLKVLEKSKRGFTYGTRVRSKGFPYPGIHNIGGRGGRPPRRRWLFLNKQDLAQMVKATIDHIQNRLRNYKSYVRGK